MALESRDEGSFDIFLPILWRILSVCEIYQNEFWEYRNMCPLRTDYQKYIGQQLKP